MQTLTMTCVCEECKLEREDPKAYNLTMRIREHASHEEMHDRLRKMNHQNYCSSSQDWHKNERLKLEKEYRTHIASKKAMG